MICASSTARESNTFYDHFSQPEVLELQQEFRFFFVSAYFFCLRPCDRESPTENSQHVEKRFQRRATSCAALSDLVRIGDASGTSGWEWEMTPFGDGFSLVCLTIYEPSRLTDLMTFACRSRKRQKKFLFLHRGNYANFLIYLWHDLAS